MFTFGGDPGAGPGAWTKSTWLHTTLRSNPTIWYTGRETVCQRMDHTYANEWTTFSKTRLIPLMGLVYIGNVNAWQDLAVLHGNLTRITLFSHAVKTPRCEFCVFQVHSDLWRSYDCWEIPLWGQSQVKTGSLKSGSPFWNPLHAHKRCHLDKLPEIYSVKRIYQKCRKWRNIHPRERTQI